MQNTRTDIMNINDMRLYWKSIFGTEIFEEDETTRIVVQAKAHEHAQATDYLMTENTKLDSFDNFMTFLNNKLTNSPNHDIGISISSAIFDYDKTRVNEKGNIMAPSINSFKKINTMVLDIDAHLNNRDKTRFFVHTLDDNQISTLILKSYLEVVSILRTYNLDFIKPYFTACTGGGIQIAFKFDRELYAEEAKSIFYRFKKILGKHTFQVLVQDIMGNFSEVVMEVDATFADISHTQRFVGYQNQKYGYIPKFFNNYLDASKNIIPFELNENSSAVFKTMLKDIQESINISNYEEEKKKAYNQYYLVLFKNFSDLLKMDLEIPYLFNADTLLEDARISNIQEKTSINPNEYSSMEYDLIQELKSLIIEQPAILEKLFPEIEWEYHGNYLKIKCPFHPEDNPSMSFYPNSLIFKDFHDDKNYNIITFYSAYFKINKTTAISKIIDQLGIKINKANKKDFQKLELEETMEILMDKIDTDNYIYYRLANKNRSCVIRCKETGESFTFDGPKMLSSHVMQNQLNIKDVDHDFIKEFQETFERKILIEAFEEFHPGKPTVFEREFIKFVNLWVPSKNYKLAHENKEALKEELLEELELEESLELIRKVAPFTFKYLLQITQKGNLKWFLNWMINTSKFNVMPTIPVVYGTPGVGKNLFVNTIMNWYHNSEYSKTLNSDRVMSNFNSVLESASLIVLDEGDISSSRDFDALKFLSGNDKLMIEKKGVDAVAKNRFFNIIMFSNGEVPVRHSYDDRRIQYFFTEKTLLQFTKELNISIEEFVNNVTNEQENFWGILLHTKTDPRMSIGNVKDKIFITQILKQHSFGELILKLLKNQWKDIALQLNENISDETLMKANLDLLKEIKNQFETSGKVSLTLINRYLNALNFRYKTSIQRFIQHNNLEEAGLTIEVTETEVIVCINKSKLHDLSKIRSNLELLNKKRIKAVEEKIEKERDIEELGDNFKMGKEVDDTQTNLVSSQTPDLPQAPELPTLPGL